MPDSTNYTYLWFGKLAIPTGSGIVVSVVCDVSKLTKIWNIQNSVEEK